MNHERKGDCNSSCYETCLACKRERTYEIVAIELHKFYRAANKALYPGGYTDGGNHDHGWKNCKRKRYFEKRGKILLKAMGEE